MGAGEDAVLLKVLSLLPVNSLFSCTPAWDIDQDNLGGGALMSFELCPSPASQVLVIHALVNHIQSKLTHCEVKGATILAEAERLI